MQPYYYNKFLDQNIAVTHKKATPVSRRETKAIDRSDPRYQRYLYLKESLTVPLADQHQDIAAKSEVLDKRNAEMRAEVERLKQEMGIVGNGEIKVYSPDPKVQQLEKEFEDLKSRREKLTLELDKFDNATETTHPRKFTQKPP